MAAVSRHIPHHDHHVPPLPRRMAETVVSMPILQALRKLRHALVPGATHGLACRRRALGEGHVAAAVDTWLDITGVAGLSIVPTDVAAERNRAERNRAELSPELVAVAHMPLVFSPATLAGLFTPSHRHLPADLLNAQCKERKIWGCCHRSSGAASPERRSVNGGLPSPPPTPGDASPPPPPAADPAPAPPDHVTIGMAGGFPDPDPGRPAEAVTDEAPGPNNRFFNWEACHITSGQSQTGTIFQVFSARMKGMGKELS